MPDHPPRKLADNRILRSLSREDRELLEPYLFDADLPVRKRLESPDKRIEDVYFIDRGFASVVAKGTRDTSVEIGLIGREGVTGLAVIMGTDRSPFETFMQSAGAGRRIATDRLRRAMSQSPVLHQSLLIYGHAFVVQAARTALVNARPKIDQRLARWLCMAHDRSDGDELTLTHEFLAIMLGVQRPGVSLSLEALQRAGLIMTKRGVISIVDRARLEQAAKGTYGKPEGEINRLFG
jgi:CRP-like cAMP-binding protein